MSANKYLAFDPTNGVSQQVTPAVVSAGGPDANKIVALNSSGVLDPSVLPTGVGVEMQPMPSSENFSAGALVNIWDNAGATTARNADGSTTAKEANGFVIAATVSPATANVYFPGQKISGLSGLTPGATYFLSDTTPGAMSTTVPSTAGHICQVVGKALSATTFLFSPGTPIEL